MELKRGGRWGVKVIKLGVKSYVTPPDAAAERNMRRRSACV